MPCENYPQITYNNLIKHKSHRIIILLTNGLGNKLSTLALGLLFAKRNKINDIIFIHVRSPHELDECYDLSLFTNLRIYSIKNKCLDDLFKYDNKSVIDNRFAANRYTKDVDPKLIIWTKFFTILQFMPNKDYTKKYFQKLYHKIYKYNSNVTIKNDVNNYSIGVHVRLGDFIDYNVMLNKDRFLILNPKYYIERINSITDSFIKIHGNKTTLRVYFFSDNTNNFIEKHILPYIFISNVIIPKEISAIDSLVALSRCDFLILGQSSFSTTAMLLKRTIGLEYYPAVSVTKDFQDTYGIPLEDLDMYFGNK